MDDVTEPIALTAESAAHDETPLNSERLARTLAKIVMFQFGLIVAMAGIFSYYIVHAIHTNRTNIHELACFLVQGSPDSAAPVVHEFRVKYSCPAFDPVRAKDFQPRTSPGPTVTRIVPGPTRLVSTPTTMVVPGPTVTLPGTRRTVTARRTVTVPAPRPTVCFGKVCVTIPASK